MLEKLLIWFLCHIVACLSLPYILDAIDRSQSRSGWCKPALLFLRDLITSAFSFASRPLLEKDPNRADTLQSMKTTVAIPLFRRPILPPPYSLARRRNLACIAQHNGQRKTCTTWKVIRRTSFFHATARFVRQRHYDGIRPCCWESRQVLIHNSATAPSLHGIIKAHPSNLPLDKEASHSSRPGCQQNSNTQVKSTIASLSTITHIQASHAALISGMDTFYRTRSLI